MSEAISKILQAAQAGFESQQRQIEEAYSRQMRTVTRKIATGTKNINCRFQLSARFKLVYVRCHFTGADGAAPFMVGVDSRHGEAYSAVLHTQLQAGLGRDVNFCIASCENTDPSPWAFEDGDSVSVSWQNPFTDNITWGLEVGLALAL